MKPTFDDFKKFLTENISLKDNILIDTIGLEAKHNFIPPEMWFWTALKQNSNKATMVENKWQKFLMNLKNTKRITHE